MIDGKRYLEANLLELVGFAESGQTEAAIDLLDTLEASSPEVSPESRDWFIRSIAAHRGETYVSAGRLDLALIAYSKAQDRIHEHYPQNQGAIANIYAAMGRYEDSIKAIEKGLRIAFTA